MADYRHDEAKRKNNPPAKIAAEGSVMPMAKVEYACERVSAQAILRVTAREDVQRELFADPQQQYHEAVQFYPHDIDWTNRLILGADDLPRPAVRD